MEEGIEAFEFRIVPFGKYFVQAFAVELGLFGELGHLPPEPRPHSLLPAGTFRNRPPLFVSYRFASSIFLVCVRLILQNIGLLALAWASLKGLPSIRRLPAGPQEGRSSQLAGLV